MHAVRAFAWALTHGLDRLHVCCPDDPGSRLEVPIRDTRGSLIAYLGASGLCGERELRTGFRLYLSYQNARMNLVRTLIETPSPALAADLPLGLPEWRAVLGAAGERVAHCTVKLGLKGPREWFNVIADDVRRLSNLGFLCPEDGKQVMCHLTVRALALAWRSVRSRQSWLIRQEALRGMFLEKASGREGLARSNPDGSALMDTLAGLVGESRGHADGLGAVTRNDVEDVARLHRHLAGLGRGTAFRPAEAAAALRKGGTGFALPESAVELLARPESRAALCRDRDFRKKLDTEFVEAYAAAGRAALHAVKLKIPSLGPLDPFDSPAWIEYGLSQASMADAYFGGTPGAGPAPAVGTPNFLTFQGMDLDGNLVPVRFRRVSKRLDTLIRLDGGAGGRTAGTGVSGPPGVAPAPDGGAGSAAEGTDGSEPSEGTAAPEDGAGSAAGATDGSGPPEAVPAPDGGSASSASCSDGSESAEGAAAPEDGTGSAEAGTDGSESSEGTAAPGDGAGSAEAGTDGSGETPEVPSSPDGVAGRGTAGSGGSGPPEVAPGPPGRIVWHPKPNGRLALLDHVREKMSTVRRAPGLTETGRQSRYAAAFHTLGRGCHLNHLMSLRLAGPILEWALRHGVGLNPETLDPLVLALCMLAPGFTALSLDLGLYYTAYTILTSMSAGEVRELCEKSGVAPPADSDLSIRIGAPDGGKPTVLYRVAPADADVACHWVRAADTGFILLPGEREGDVRDVPAHDVRLLEDVLAEHGCVDTPLRRLVRWRRCVLAKKRLREAEAALGIAREAVTFAGEARRAGRRRGQAGLDAAKKKEKLELKARDEADDAARSFAPDGKGPDEPTKDDFQRVSGLLDELAGLGCRVPELSGDDGPPAPVTMPSLSILDWQRSCMAAMRVALRRYSDVAGAAFALAGAAAESPDGAGKPAADAGSREKAARALGLLHGVVFAGGWKDDRLLAAWQLLAALPGHVARKDPADGPVWKDGDGTVLTGDAALSALAGELLESPGLAGKLGQALADAWLHDERLWSGRIREVDRAFCPRHDDPTRFDRGGYGIPRIRTLKAYNSLRIALQCRRMPDGTCRTAPPDFLKRKRARVPALFRERERLGARCAIALAEGRPMFFGRWEDGVRKPESPPDGHPVCHAIIVEGMRDFRPSGDRSRRGNRVVMELSAPGMIRSLARAARAAGIAFRTVDPEFSSQTEPVRLGWAVRCDVIPRAEFFGPYWRGRVARAREREAAGRAGAEDGLLRDLDGLLSGLSPAELEKVDRLTVLRKKGGRVLVPCDSSSPALGLNADSCASANVGLLAFRDPACELFRSFVLRPAGTGQRPKAAAGSGGGAPGPAAGQGGGSAGLNWRRMYVFRWPAFHGGGQSLLPAHVHFRLVEAMGCRVVMLLNRSNVVRGSPPPGQALPGMV
jgi:hypothetical protein